MVCVCVDAMRKGQKAVNVLESNMLRWRREIPKIPKSQHGFHHVDWQGPN